MLQRTSQLGNIDIDSRKGFQHRITPLFRSTPIGSAMHHLRHRLNKWPMQTLPGHRPERARKVLQLLHEHATPKVQAAYLRTICDGWCTKSRFQQHGCCMFGCGYEHDLLQHIARCRVVETLFSPLNLAIHRGGDALDVFYCMEPISGESLTTRARALYALYRLHNSIRHGHFQPSEYHGSFNSYFREAAG